ncbi:unnamed protein product, partial [marine sediment metagenome]
NSEYKFREGIFKSIYIYGHEQILLFFILYSITLYLYK